MNEAREEFGQIYNENIEGVYRFVFLKVESKEVAEDLTSETFAKVWKVFEKKRQGNKPLASPKSFCYKTARNLVIDHYRRKSKRQVVPVDSVPLSSDENLEEKMAINSDMRSVMAALKNIKGDYQDIIIWRYLDELSIGEIALLIGKSEGATRVMVHRALDCLKNVLEA